MLYSSGFFNNIDCIQQPMATDVSIYLIPTAQVSVTSYLLV